MQCWIFYEIKLWWVTYITVYFWYEGTFSWWCGEITMTLQNPFSLCSLLKSKETKASKTEMLHEQLQGALDGDNILTCLLKNELKFIHNELSCIPWVLGYVLPNNRKCIVSKVSLCLKHWDKFCLLLHVGIS